MRLLTTKVEFAALLCTPEVIRSNFSPADPVQGWRVTGIKFWRKSPAVGSTKRQFPSAALSETEEKARTAVPSRGLDSAAADGWRTPPARETGTAVVGLASATLAAGVTDAGDDDEDADADDFATLL